MNEIHEVHQTAQDGGDGDDQAKEKVDLGEEVGVARRLTPERASAPAAARAAVRRN